MKVIYTRTMRVKDDGLGKAMELNFKKESHHLEIGETGLTKNLSTTGG